MSFVFVIQVDYLDSQGRARSLVHSCNDLTSVALSKQFAEYNVISNDCLVSLSRASVNIALGVNFYVLSVQFHTSTR